MVTDPPIEPDLLEHAQTVDGDATGRATVAGVMGEYLARRERATMCDLFGTFERDLSFDHRAHRERPGRR